VSLSSRSTSLIASSNVLNQNETYPDRSATDGSIIQDTGSGTFRLDKNAVPRTSDDMSRLYKWRIGDLLYGTHATKEELGMNLYIKDILNAPDESEYKHNQISIDTFKSVGPQLEKYNK